MIQINNELELFQVKGHVLGGKILLFNRLEKTLTKDEIKKKVVDDYAIMKSGHFTNSWNKYISVKRFMKLKDDE